MDGIQVFRISGTNNSTEDPGADWGEDGDLDGVTYAFKFPGKPGEQNYPFWAPIPFLTLAQDAYDHTKAVATSIDFKQCWLGICEPI